MAKQGGSGDADSRPRLRVQVVEAHQFVEARVGLGRDLVSVQVQSEDDLATLSSSYQRWSAYNDEWLAVNVSKSVADQYTGRNLSHVATAGARPPTLAERAQRVRNTITTEINHLLSIDERFELWAGSATASGGKVVDADGPIFVVHGHNQGLAYQVARVLERSTGREVTILHERANEGRTLIEKFEHNSERAAFAVVLLTADDEGRALSGPPDLRPRARQNVIFELGFFFGLLGRGRVAVLRDHGVEDPSDVDGLAYVSVDAAGAWKQLLARELEAASIEVDRSQIP